MNDIDNCHRVGPFCKEKTRDIIVKFTSYRARTQFIKGRKSLRDKKETIYINEDLTKFRSDLARDARLMKKDPTTKVKGTWTFNGNIYIETENEDIIKITNKYDLLKYKGKP